MRKAFEGDLSTQPNGVQQTCGGWWAGRPEVAPALQGHIFEVEMEPHGDVGAGSLHLQVDKAVDSGLHLGRIIVVDLAAHGWWLPGVNHKNSISWSLMPGARWKVFLEVGLERRLEGVQSSWVCCTQTLAKWAGSSRCSVSRQVSSLCANKRIMPLNTVWVWCYLLYQGHWLSI